MPARSPAPGDSDWGPPRTRSITWYSAATLAAAAAELSGRELLQAISSG